MAKFKVLVDSLTFRTSKPTDPFTFKRYAKGEELEISDSEEATRLIDAGAVVESGQDPEQAEDEAVQELKPGTDGGAGFSGGVHLTPEQEGEQQLARVEAAQAATEAAETVKEAVKKTGAEVETAQPAETSKPAKPAKPARS